MKIVDYRKNIRIYIFCGIMIFAYLLHIFLFTHNPDGLQKFLYFRGFEDFCADFFNCCIHVADRNPYFTDYFFQSNYLPLVNLIFYPFSKLADYKNFSLADCWNSHVAIFSCFIFILFSVIVFVHSIILMCEKYKTSRIVLVSILLSGVFLHTIERANILILSTALLFYFLTYYDSDNKRLSYFAAICLAFVSVIKVYPVLFGILYLIDYKKYIKQIAFAFIVFLIATFLPFLFFKHGFHNLPRLLEILSKTGTPLSNNNTRFDFQYCSYLLLCLLRLKDYSNITVIIRYVTLFVALFSLLLVFIQDDFFKRLCLIILPLLYIPAFSWFYCAIYLIPALIYFLGDDCKIEKKRVLFYSIFFFSIFVPLGLPNIKGVDVKIVIINLFCFIIWSQLLFDSVKQLVSKKTKTD